MKTTYSITVKGGGKGGAPWKPKPSPPQWVMPFMALFVSNAVAWGVMAVLFWVTT